MGKYDDIINLPHHESDHHPRMPMSHRAAQFAPFAALSGHDDAIAETVRITEIFRELSEEEKVDVSRKLKFGLENDSLIEITYFIPDKLKKGGKYETTVDKIKKLDEYDQKLILKNGTCIPLIFIQKIEIKNRE